ncbi:protocadherin Fat 4-like isoform X4 [Anguilla rostrata]|uniref:protocadherin Fat 4-like isoform X4 n=1 Tax=Anguilla rostrata TaxID=7938 RepID=UPI0030D37575
MGRLRSLEVGVILLLAQAFRSGFCEEGVPCQPSFGSEVFEFSVHRLHLHMGTRLGKVHFEDCGGDRKVLFRLNSHIEVDSDGTVRLKKPVELHGGERHFTIAILGSKSESRSATVRVVHVRKHGHGDHHQLHHHELKHHHHHTDDHQQSEHSEVDGVPEEHSAALPQLVFPHSFKGLKRRKRDWVIPPISVPENDRGPFPKFMVEIRSSRAKEVKVQYSITGPGADQPPVGLFIINRENGRLSVTQPLDREKNDTYILLAHADALGDSVSRAEDPMDIVIKVIDQNDNSPEFTMDPFLGNVAESSPKGFEFMKVTAIDKDEPGSENADIRYKLLTQNPESPKPDMFFINPSTGGIQLNTDGLDRENFREYTLIIQAADMMGEGRRNTCTAIVTVTDSNDNAPQFEHSSHSAALPQLPHSSKGLKRRKRDWVIPPISVSENERGPFPKLMVQIRSSRDKEVKVQYSITGPGADQPPVGLFTINRDTGWLSVTQPLDREKEDKYKLLAHAVALGDSASRAEDPMDIIINVIDQNDNRPEFTMDPFLGDVAESSPKGFEFMKVTAIDKDEPGSANADIRYKLLIQNPESPKPDMFFINPSTGGIQINSDGLDRENFPKYTLIIQAADMMGEGLATTCTAIITVTDSNDNAPQFVHSSHSAALPQPVFPHSSRKWYWVIPPIIISENERGPFPKLMVLARYSRDEEAKLQYSITGPGADQPPVGLFTINRDTGWLSVTQPLDREKEDKYKLLVHAVALGDSASRAEDPVDITIKVIDQNDNRPEFTMDPFLGNVAESSPKSFEFMKVTAIDKDEPGSAYADIRYKLLIQNPESPKPDMFFINSSTGGIQINSDGLDRENFPKYTLIIQAADMMGEGLATTCTAIVTVTDSNDNAPQFVHSSHSAALPQPVFPHSSRNWDWVIPPISVSENERGPFPKLMVQIRYSRDKEVKVQYSITGPGADQPPVGLFTINRDTGWLSVTQPLDREKNDKYKLLAHAVALGDSASSAKDSMDIIINVIDQNDNRPEFTMGPFLGNVAESSPKGFEFMKVTAIDKDEPGSANADIRYKLLIQNPESPKADMFFINPSTGGIQLNSDGLDRENFPKYTLIIQAADMMGEGLATTCTAIVTVTDSNDNAPQFEHSSHSAALPQPVCPHSSRKWGWVIPPISISENDRGPFPKLLVQIRSSRDKEVKLQYSITGPGADQPPVGLFTINRDTGWLSVTQHLDREKEDKYRLLAHAVVFGVSASPAEAPMDIVIKVIDQNDNSPEFTMDPFLGNVAESSPKGFEFMKVTAIDKDEPGSANADIRYKLLTQNPESPKPDMFFINPSTGGIQLKTDGLDRENFPKYTLTIQAADMVGKGLATTCTAIVTVTDSNDNAPQFEHSSYTASVPENEVGALVVKMTVTDRDEVHTPAWTTKYKIIDGNNGGFFNVSTGPSKLEGIITTVKGLDFEKNARYTLLVTVENDAPFATRLPTSTATVIVDVKDVNEAPVFNPVERVVIKPENLEVGADIIAYTATDPDTARNQKVWYKSGSDPAGWLNVNRETGLIKVRSPMDRESPFVIGGKYRALINAIDNDDIPATGTGTLLIELEDVNDNAPIIEESTITICNQESQPVTLSVSDRDGPGFAAPFRAELQGDSGNHWTVRMNGTKTGIILALKTHLEQNDYNVILRVYDNQGLFQNSTVQAKVCDCKGDDFTCKKRVVGVGMLGILGILGAILLLLLLVLLLLMFLRRRSRPMKEEPLLHDDVRGNLYYYDEEGGGEEDQDYDLSQLHRGLDNRPDVMRDDVAPTFLPVPQYRTRPTNPEDIGNFIDDNLKAADGDPTALPYDSLLVFDYEGGRSEAGSLSSLNSSSSGEDQDYDCLDKWGPRFKKLADMYGGGED